MLVTKNDVEILENGDWFFQGNRIDNQQVLRYFKANLGRDEQGYFIINRFGERIEKGYLKSVKGFALFVVRLLVLEASDLGNYDAALFANAKEVEKIVSHLHARQHGCYFQVSLDSEQIYLLPMDRLCFFDETLLAVRLGVDARYPVYARLSAGSMAALAEILREEGGDYYLSKSRWEEGSAAPFRLPRAKLQEIYFDRDMD